MEKKGVKETLSRLVYGVYLLTTLREGEINGMPVSWVSQVSHNPPLVMVAVAEKRYTHSMLKESQVFALNLVDRNRKELMDGFVTRQGPRSSKFNKVRHREGQTGCPILEEVLAYLECRVTASYSAGDHTIFIGEVVDAASIKEGVSLSEWDYGYSYGG